MCTPPTKQLTFDFFQSKISKKSLKKGIKCANVLLFVHACMRHTSVVHHISASRGSINALPQPGYVLKVGTAYLHFKTEQIQILHCLGINCP